MKEDIAWERFWGEGIFEFAFDPSGFLADPRSEYFSQNSALKTLDSYEESPCLILLGEMGIGKTSEIKRHNRALVERGLRSKRFNLAEYDASTLDELFDDLSIKAWQASTTELLYIFLDSFDEALMSMQTLGDRLCRRLETWDVARLRLRIVCRSGIWPSTTEEKLHGILPISVLTMAPLRYDDVLLAAGAWGVNEPEKFVTAVQEAGATAFAIKPGTLDFLVKEYLAKGQLSANETELYDTGCRLLCSEPIERTDRRHEGSLTADQRVSIAGRIAALMLCCGKSHFCDLSAQHDLRDTDLSFDVVLRGLELIQETATPLMRTQVVEVAFSGLFRQSGAHRVCWSHYSYAEHLAARYMSRALSTQQILMLLLHPAGSRAVIPQLAGLAARLAVMDKRVFAGLVTDNPDLLLEGDGKAFHPEQRAALVASLLQSLSAGKLRVRWERQRRFHLLCHRSLSGQLRPYIRTGRVQSRIAAIAMAGACKCVDLGKLLLKTALAPNEETAIRTEAADAIADIGDGQLVKGLYSLIVDATLNDENNELKGIALDRVWKKRLIGAKEVFSNLTQPNAAIHGAYDRFLLDLPDSLGVDDLPAAFSWIQAQPGWAAQSQPFQDLVDRILAKAVDHLTQPGTAALLVDVVKLRIQRNWQTGWTHGEPKFTSAISQATEELRRELVEKFAATLSSLDFSGSTLSLPLRDFVRSILKASDFQWLLSICLAETNHLKKIFFAHSTRLAWDNSDPTAYEAAIQAQRSDPSVAEAFSGDFGYVLLDSDAARRGRELFAGPPQNPPPDRSRIDADIDELLDTVERGDVAAWWRIAITLTWSTPTMGQSEWLDDVRKLPGWELASENRRTRILNAAQLYVLRGAQSGDDYARSDTKRPAAAAYRALLLLQNERPEFILSIPAATLASWVWAVLSYPTMALANNMRDADKAIVECVISADLTGAIAVLGTLVQEPKQQQQLGQLIRRLDWPEIIGLESFFETILEAYQWPTAQLEPLLSYLISRESDPGRGFAEKILQQPLRQGDAVERALSTARVLLRSAPEHYWPKLWTRARTSVPLAGGLVEQLAGWVKPNVSLMGRLSEEQLAQVYLWVAKHHPGLRYRGPLDGGPLGMVQYSIPGHLAARGTEQAVATLAKMINRVGQTPELDHYLAEARERLLSSTWTPTDADSLIQMFIDRRKRYVGTPEQLISVVIEALGEVQAELQGTPPIASLLWDQWGRGTTSRPTKRNTKNGGQRPKDEEALSDFIAVALRGRIQHRNIVVNREVQIRRGQETDIHIEALPLISTSDDVRVPRVIIEVKGCWNQHLKTDIQNQLVVRYLQSTPQSAGVYLVGWFRCRNWREPPGSRRLRQTPVWSIEKAHIFLRREPLS